MTSGPGGTSVRAVVEVLARALTDRPELVTVVETPHKGGILVELFVGTGELGRVIGRQGRTVKALRSLLHAAGQKHDRRYVLELVE